MRITVSTTPPDRTVAPPDTVAYLRVRGAFDATYPLSMDDLDALALDVAATQREVLS